MAGHKVSPELESDGFVVCPQVLTQSEVALLREQVGEHLDRSGRHKTGGTVLPNAAAEAPSLWWVFCHPGILSAVREVTGLSALVFTMEADLHRNYAASNWHKDSGEQAMAGGYFQCDAFGSDDCRVYKVALYLQDHHGQTGLHIRRGSTRTADFTVGEDVAIRAVPGDAVVFDVRVTHRGIRPPLVERGITDVGDTLASPWATHGAARLRRAKNRVLLRPDRLAVYFAFGSPNERSTTFARRNMERQVGGLGREPSPLPNALVEAFGRADVQTVDL